MPDHRESDSAAHACPCGTLSIFWNVEPWDCLAEGQPAATFTSQNIRKGREGNLNPLPPPQTVYTTLRIQGTHKSKKIHTPLICW